MATSDNVSLLSRVVNFVSSPTQRKAAPDGSSQRAQEVVDKASIQAMMDRKLHNDVVRKREFELLRQMRRREPHANRLDLHERTSMFPTSILTPPSGRAQTIKKIDEIEQQMSQQWWKGKQVKGGSPSSRPAPASQLPAASVTPAKPAAVAPAVELPKPTARLEASLYDEPPATGPSEFLPTQVNRFVHDPEVEDAAILFANGDYEGAGLFLQGLLRDGDVQGEQEQIWMTLFDLYRVTGDRTRFDGAAIDFAARFGRSAPQWGTSIEIGPRALAPEIQVMAAGKGSEWTSPAHLGPQQMGQLSAVADHCGTPWSLNWSQLSSVDEAVVPEMARLFSTWCKTRMRLRFTGAKQLDELLRLATPAGNPEVAGAWWLWRLDSLRLGQREDEFELVALDYCITYEMSPPAWERSVCDFSSSEAEAADEAHNALQPLAMGEDLLSTLAGAFSSTSAGGATGFHVVEAEPGGATSPNLFALVELSGEVRGDASVALAKLDKARSGFDKLVVDCRNLVRVDFPAAGSLLNWTSARTTEGCKVEFKNVNRLVATFFSVIGIDEFARIIPPSH